MLEMLIDSVYLANGYQLDEFPINPMVSLISSSAGDIASCVFMTIIAGVLFTSFSSRTVLICSICLLIVCSYLYMTPFPTSTPPATAISLFLLHLFLFNLDINVAQVFSVTFPKPIENICVGLCLCASSMGRFLGPYLIRIAEDNQMNPFVLFIGLMVVFGLFPAIFFPNSRT